MKALWLVVFVAACSAGKDDGASPRIDCSQEAGTVATVDGGGLAEATRGLPDLPRAFDAGGSVDACPDMARLAERAADVAAEVSRDTAPGVDLPVFAEVSHDTAPGVDGGGLDSQPLDGGDDAQCPNPRTIPIGGNCMICGEVGGPCCFSGAPCGAGLACKNWACVVQP